MRTGHELMARPVRSDSVHQSFNNAFSTDNPLPTSNDSYAAIQHTPFVNVKANSNVFKVDVAGIVDYVVAAKFATAKDDWGRCHRLMEGVGIIYSWISFSVESAVDRFRCRQE